MSSWGCSGSGSTGTAGSEGSGGPAAVSVEFCSGISSGSGTSNAGSGGTATFIALRGCLLITINLSSPSTGFTILPVVLELEEFE